MKVLTDIIKQHNPLIKMILIGSLLLMLVIIYKSVMYFLTKGIVWVIKFIK